MPQLLTPYIGILGPSPLPLVPTPWIIQLQYPLSFLLGRRQDVYLLTIQDAVGECGR